MYEIEQSDTRMEDVTAFIAKYHKNRTTVNMYRLINENNNPEILKAISSRAIEGLNWEHTEYADCWVKNNDPKSEPLADETHNFSE